MSSNDDKTPWVGADYQQGAASGKPVLCGACKKIGRCRLGLIHRGLDEAGVSYSTVICPPEYEGGPQVAHGGWTASVLDEMLGETSVAQGQMVVTATLTVDFIKPVPINHELEGRGWIERREGSRVYISGELRLASSNALLAKASGIFIARDFSHFERHQKWLAEQDKNDGA